MRPGGTTRAEPYPVSMYELEVCCTFSAAHALTIGGRREPLHGHDWHVSVILAGDQLDGDGLLCDFHTVRDQLVEIVHPFDNDNLNDAEAFEETNPSAEHVARYIHRELSARLDEALAPFARVAAVRVTESPGCAATYRP